MTKKLLIVMAAAAAISLLFAACFVEFDPTDVPKGDAMGTHSGPGTGTAQGAIEAGGNNLTVNLLLENGYIIDVQIVHNETPTFGGLVAKNAPNEIKTRNSVEIDTVSHATQTSEAIRKAGRKALFQATNGEFGSENGNKL